MIGGQPQPLIKEVTVKRGPVEASIQATGIVQAATQAPLTFRVSGVVQDVKVKPGDAVNAGQDLVVLAAPDLQAQVQVAQAGVEAAEAKLAQAQAGSRPEDVAIAQAQVEAAQAKLSQLQKQGRPEDIAAAQAAVDAARAKLSEVQAGGRPDVVAQQAAQVQAAQAKLDAILAGGKPDAVAQAEQQVRSAQAKLDAIQAGPNPATVAQAQAKLDQAKAQLAAMQAGPRPEQIAVYEKAVEIAKDNLYAAQANRDAINGRKDAASWQVDQGKAQVAAAQTALDQAQAQLQLQLSPATPQDIAQQQAVVAQAQAALQAAQTVYTPQDVQQAQAAVDQAKAALHAAQVPYTAQDVQQARAAVAQAQAALGQARQPNAPQDIQSAQDAVTQAQATLAKVTQPYEPEDLAMAAAALEVAKEQLALKQHPYTKEDLDVMRAAVDQAKAQLAVAQASVDQTALKAPFDGTVQQVNVVPGQVVTSGTGANASTLTNTPPVVLGSGKPTVDATVDETDIARIRVGQPVTYSFDALPGKVFSGKVDRTPEAGTLEQGVVGYDLQCSIDPVSGTDLIKPGMTATVRVQVAKKDDALLLPYTTIQIFNGKASVNLPNPQNPAQPIHRDVTLGLTDGTMVEIVDGLKAGDKVIQFGWREDVQKPGSQTLASQVASRPDGP